MFCLFGHEACGILIPQPGTELEPLRSLSHWTARGVPTISINTPVMSNVASRSPFKLTFRLFWYVSHHFFKHSLWTAFRRTCTNSSSSCPGFHEHILSWQLMTSHIHSSLVSKLTASHSEACKDACKSESHFTSLGPSQLLLLSLLSLILGTSHYQVRGNL